MDYLLTLITLLTLFCIWIFSHKIKITLHVKNFLNFYFSNYSLHIELSNALNFISLYDVVFKPVLVRAKTNMIAH